MSLIWKIPVIVFLAGIACLFLGSFWEFVDSELLIAIAGGLIGLSILVLLFVGPLVLIGYLIHWVWIQ